METDTQEGQEFTDAMRMPVLKIVRRGNATSIVFTLPGYARLLILAITAKLLGVDLAAVGKLANTLLTARMPELTKAIVDSVNIFR